MIMHVTEIQIGEQVQNMQKQSANFFRVAFLKLDIESKIMQIEVEILI